MPRRVDTVLFPLFVSAFFCNVATWAVLLWKMPYTQNTLFLHYNVFFGVDLTGSWAQMLVLPISGLVILIINTLPLVIKTHMTRITKMAISILTLLFQLMLLVGAMLIILLNTA